MSNHEMNGLPEYRNEEFWHWIKVKKIDVMKSDNKAEIVRLFVKETKADEFNLVGIAKEIFVTMFSEFKGSLEDLAQLSIELSK